MATRKQICTRCPAEALWEALLTSGAVVNFCGHHHDEHAAKLEEVGAFVRPVDVKPVKVECCDGCMRGGIFHPGYCAFDGPVS